MTAVTNAPVSAEAPPAPALSPPPTRTPTDKVALHQITAESIGSLVFSALAAVSLMWVLYERILPFDGAFGFWLLTYVTFVAFYAGVSYLQFGIRVMFDRMSGVLTATGGLFVLGALIDLVAYTIYRGRLPLGHPNFFTHTMAFADALSPLSSGGAMHAAVGSLEQLGIAIAITLPLGILTALYLAEVGGKLARVIRTVVEAMTALPSIVAGLFVLSLYIVTLHLPKGGFAAALAISVMMLPIITRAAEVVLRLVPDSLREAGYALGSSHWRVAWNVVLPTARSGLTTAVVLGMARGIGETSPVLLTAGFTKELNTNPFSGPQTNLPVFVFTYFRYPQQIQVERAFGAALLLMIIVLVLFVSARVLGGAAPGELNRRQRRSLARANARAHAASAAAASTEALQRNPEMGTT
jgi:phosphate transport system permease protein